ncbi:uncharacterized protein si:ch211-152c8.2 [Larimichthys crocea]|uniref:uncharacterized protein si:ch211-152c8.2 n=1 Tax=Larimichthys crocea TaxID=215358 RepID=UPI000F5FFC20|nr:uncharacterized protein LOC104935849 [Larimichthys crocea]
MQSQVVERDGDWPSSSSSPPPFFYHSSSQLPLSSSPPSSSVRSPLPPPSQTPVISAPRLVPIFKNKCPSRHVNVALLRVQKLKEQLSGGGGGGEERERVTLPVFRKTPTTAPVSSLSALTIPPPPIIPRFSHHSAAPQPGHPRVKHLSSLSPAAKSRLRLNPAPQIQIKFKSRPSSKNKVTFSMDCKPAAESSCDQQDQAARPPSAAPPEPPRPHTSSDVSSKDTSSSSRKGVVFESKPKKSRSAVRDVDVEQMARSNQLSQLNSATLLAWLRGRGALVSSKHRKEELMLKVMSCLAEA